MKNEIWKFLQNKHTEHTEHTKHCKYVEMKTLYKIQPIWQKRNPIHFKAFAEEKSSTPLRHNYDKQKELRNSQRTTNDG